MKKNKKGFTLIELLAVLVLLGILAVFSLPVITRVISNSRNKMFITDAKKLISQAEYKMRANSSDIITPQEGQCIVISLSYLNSSSITDGPNGGKYDLDSSYVVVRKRSAAEVSYYDNHYSHTVEEGKTESDYDHYNKIYNFEGFEYLVNLVERSKSNTYTGVFLTKESSLYSTYRKTTSMVSGFSRQDLIDTETITAQYINQALKSDYQKDKEKDSKVQVYNGTFVTTIAQAYHYQELRDIGTGSGKYSPAIKTIELHSKGGKNFGSLNATLILKVNDADTLRKNLQVILSNKSFEDPNPTVYNYGDNVFSTIDIDFSNYGYSYDHSENVYLYVTIKDPDGNTATQALDYTIHANDAPTVLRSILSPKTSTEEPFSGVLTLSLTDDFDASSSLLVCFSESREANSCSEYQSYSNLFNDQNKMNYTFSCNGNCQKDGKVHYLKVFIKDSLGAVTTTDAFPFTFPLEERINFNGDVKVSSKEESFTTKGSKNVIVKAPISNPDSSTKVCISASNTDEICYSYQSSNSYSFVINSPYDGSTKNVYVYAKNDSGLTSVVQTVLYTMYQDKAPTISSFQLNTSNPCVYPELCPGVTGGLNTTFSISAVDDMSQSSELRLCVSEERHYCQNLSNFQSYESNKNANFTFSGNYDGELRTVYAVVRDAFGNEAVTSTNYRVYLDKKPMMAGEASIEASYNPVDAHLLDFYYTPNVVDDVDRKLTYQICYKFDSNAFNCDKELTSSSRVLHITKSFFEDAPNDYLGQVLTIYATVKDSYHEEAVRSDNVTYTLYQDKEPQISDFAAVYQDNTATLSFTVKDYADQYQVGVSGSGNCNSVTYLDTMYSGSDYHSHTIPYSYSSGDVTLCVKDTHNHVVSKTITPTSSSNYQLCSSVSSEGATYQYMAVNENEKITRSRCQSKCYSYNPITKESNAVQGSYSRTITFKDSFQSNHTCPVVDTYTANCSFIDCFAKNENTYYQAIGVVPYEDEVPWTYELNGTTYVNTYHYKAYQVSYHNGDATITLTEIENKKISPAVLSDEDIMSNYVRVAD